jgi:hypothetical protein
MLNEDSICRLGIAVRNLGWKTNKKGRAISDPTFRLLIAF